METISTDSATMCRELSGNPNLISSQLYKAESNGHKFKVGDKCTLTGLQDFLEFNGQPVEVESIREDGTHGRCYYIKGEINKFINWVYEYRLTPNEKE